MISFGASLDPLLTALFINYDHLVTPPAAVETGDESDGLTALDAVGADGEDEDLTAIAAVDTGDEDDNIAESFLYFLQ